jgi:hypothetical protein
MDLTDENTWHLVCAPASASSRELAITHGLPLAQVMRVRLHYRREPWTCPVDYVPCIVCGELMTIAGASAGSTMHHAQCRPAPGEAIRAVRADRQRYLLGGPRHSTIPNPPRHSSIAGGRKYLRWTDEEDAVVIAHTPHATAGAIGRMLDRSEASVRTRRTRLRLEGRID